MDHYTVVRTLLADELGVEPAPETEALRQAIKADASVRGGCAGGRWAGGRRPHSCPHRGARNPIWPARLDLPVPRSPDGP
ncbi:MAG: BTAD domain-containing putative transcriptional regulator [Caldilineaceae bacterium]